jgi:hypothetical protein
MDPFLDVVVSPSYGDDRAVVSWVVVPEFKNAEFYVFRSEDGQTRWKILNDHAPVKGTQFVDTDFVVRDLLTTMHYRVLLVLGHEEYDSPVVGVFAKLSRREFGIVRRILQLELLGMIQGRQGIEVQVRSQLTHGVTCRCVDPVTKQSSQASLCPYCYGTRFEGGFTPPVQTWIRAEDWNPTTRDDDPSGKSRKDVQIVRGRALTIPTLQTDDLVIHVATDTRLAVTDVKQQLFRGIVPIYSQPGFVLLPRQDIRYKLSVT